MGNSALSILILGGFFGFLLIVSHLAILKLLKNWKLHRSNKGYDGIRQGYKSEPIYIQRNRIDTLHDISSVQEWQDMGVLPTSERPINRKKFENYSETNS